MKRAIVIGGAALILAVLLFVALSSVGGDGAVERRPVPEVKREPPNPGGEGFGTQPSDDS